MWITFYHQSKRYRKSLKLKDTAKNRKFANDNIIPELVYKINSGEFFKNEIVPTVDEYAYRSFKIHAQYRKATTQREVIRMYEIHVKPHFGERKMDEIKPSDIGMWQNLLLEKLSPSRLKAVRAVFNTIIDDAIRDERITSNPISKVRVPRIEKVEIHPFSLEEINTILSHAPGDLRNFCALGFFTGMRSGEMIGLRWEDIDFLRKEITVKRTLKMGEISTPKTVNSYRSIDIIESLMPYLEDQYGLTGKKGSFVFLNKHGENYYDIKRIRDTKWKKLLKELEIPYRTIYHMRHTFATVMIENGEDILWVSHMLGHKDSTMTLQRYAKYVRRSHKTRAAFLQKHLESV